MKEHVYYSDVIERAILLKIANDPESMIFINGYPFDYICEL